MQLAKQASYALLSGLLQALQAGWVVQAAQELLCAQLVKAQVPWHTLVSPLPLGSGVLRPRCCIMHRVGSVGSPWVSERAVSLRFCGEIRETSSDHGLNKLPHAVPRPTWHRNPWQCCVITSIPLCWVLL